MKLKGEKGGEGRGGEGREGRGGREGGEGRGGEGEEGGEGGTGGEERGGREEREGRGWQVMTELQSSSLSDRGSDLVVPQRSLILSTRRPTGQEGREEERREG